MIEPPLPRTMRFPIGARVRHVTAHWSAVVVAFHPHFEDRRLIRYSDEVAVWVHTDHLVLE